MNNKEEIICWCSNVTRGDIEKAMDAGAKSLNDIKEMTGACTICRCKELNPKQRCCKGDIRRVMAEYLTSKSEGDEITEMLKPSTCNFENPLPASFDFKAELERGRVQDFERSCKNSQEWAKEEGFKQTDVSTLIKATKN